MGRQDGAPYCTAHYQPVWVVRNYTLKMDNTSTVTSEIIVQTLLQIAHRVVEVSRDHVITMIWEREEPILMTPKEYLLGKKISEASNDGIFAKCSQLVEQVFLTRTTGTIEYTTFTSDNVPITYIIRMFLNQLDPDFVFITVEILSDTTREALTEDKWKLALDAAGDGIWEINSAVNRIYFSPKWHEIFGYSPGEIITPDDWAAKLHPDDLAIAQEHFEQYNRGELPMYIVEIRYRCKDGSYKWILSRGITTAKTNDDKVLRFIGTHQDIQERKLMEEEHGANLRLLLKLINTLPSGILVTDQYKKMIFTNKALCDIYGIEEHPKDLVGTDAEASLQSIKALYKNPDELVARIETILQAKEIVLNDELEMVDGRIIRRDYFPLSFQENYEGEIWKFTDITQQKNVDNRFEAQRLFYEHIFNNLPANVAVLTADGIILFVNPSAILNEENRQIAIGKTLWEYDRFTRESEMIITQRIDYFNTAIRTKSKVEWDERLTSKSGKTSYHRRYFYPIFKPSGEPDIVIAYGVNITDRVLAEEALKTSMDAFSHSFNYSGIGKALIAPGGKWLEVNDVICKLTGYTKEELLNTHYRDITYPEDVDIDAAHIQQLFNKEIESYTLEKRYISKTRQIVVTSLTVSLLWNSDGTPKYFICDLLDITAQKLLTDELYRQNAELEATKTNLINKIKQLEDLSHMIAHNLRWPAGNIQLLAARLLLDDDDPAAINTGFTKDEATSILHKSSIALNKNLNTLFELSEIKLNKKITYDRCDFGELSSNIVRQLQSLIYQKKALITFKFEVQHISYPHVYLESILYNFISNSLKYSNPKKIPEISITTQQKGKQVCLTVRDNGLGIDLKKYGDKIFKLNKEFHEGYDSRGVGLFLTKSQIESLDGSIEVKSIPMDGCEFIVIL